MTWLKTAFAVFDAIGAGVGHVAGWSMGGMIVQSMATAHPERVLSMTSVMSAPGPIIGERDPDVIAAFMAPAGTTRDEAAQRHLAGLKLWGSPACYDVDRITADAHAAFDRCWDPEGRARQAMAVASSPSRESALKSLKVPTLVIHGDADRLVPLDAGRATAEAVSGAHLEIIEGMGHDYPPQYWDRLVKLITTHREVRHRVDLKPRARDPQSRAGPATRRSAQTVPLAFAKSAQWAIQMSLLPRS